jgi:hypothetical protein
MIPFGGMCIKNGIWRWSWEKDFGLPYSRMGYLQDIISYFLGHGFVHSSGEPMDGRVSGDFK